jgi:hypothetical protein
LDKYVQEQYLRVVMTKLQGQTTTSIDITLNANLLRSVPGPLRLIKESSMTRPAILGVYESVAR